MITEFQGEYRWLSNFFPVKIILGGIEYRSVEHAFASAKNDDPRWKQFCQETITPGEVRREARKVILRSDWDEIKVELMRHLISLKFDQEPFRTRLLETGDQIIQEGNRWGDRFWGVDLRTGKGSNYLGRLIMEKRNRLRSS